MQCKSKSHLDSNRSIEFHSDLCFDCERSSNRLPTDISMDSVGNLTGRFPCKMMIVDRRGGFSAGGSARRGRIWAYGIRSNARIWPSSISSIWIDRVSCNSSGDIFVRLDLRSDNLILLMDRYEDLIALSLRRTRIFLDDVYALFCYILLLCEELPRRRRHWIQDLEHKGQEGW